jgi:hypothetical protein
MRQRPRIYCTESQKALLRESICITSNYTEVQVDSDKF